MDATFRGAAYRRCPRCAGLWFSARALQSDDLTSARSASRTPVQRRPIDRHACAGCSSVTEPRALNRVVIDVCTACRGVWLDAGEFEYVAAAYREWAKRAPWWLGSAAPGERLDADRGIEDATSLDPLARAAVGVAAFALNVGLSIATRGVLDGALGGSAGPAPNANPFAGGGGFSGGGSSGNA